jgi:dienelactone hydrolase
MKVIRCAAASTAMLCVASIASIASAQAFRIEPATKVLDGTPLTIQLDGLPPDARVVIIAERPVAEAAGSSRRVVYRSEATFQADAAGKLDLASARPLSGSYRHVDPRGVFWSMVATPVEAAKDWPSSHVRLAAQVGGKQVARASLELMKALPAVQIEKVARFPGAVFATLPGARKRPAVILLGGSEGGAQITAHAAPLASHGFAVLALPYYSPQPRDGAPEVPELPRAFADLPVERLDEARAWLRGRATVDATRIAVHGTSKGAELALLAGVHLPWITAVVAVVPTDVVWEGWGPGVEPGKRSSFSLRGKPLPFVPYVDFAEEFTGFQAGEPVRMRRFQDKGRAANPAAAVAARIPVERIKAPVLVVGGHDDQVWASGMMAQNIAERRHEAGRETVALIYTDAGHALGATGYGPTTRHDTGLLKLGGTPKGNARAQADAWPRTIAFLARTLGTTPPPAATNPP